MSEENESGISTVNINDNYYNDNSIELNTKILLLEKLEERARNKIIKRYDNPNWL